MENKILDQVAIDWVSSEINESIQLTQKEMKSFIENSDNTESLKVCISSLKEVKGVLQILDLEVFCIFTDEIIKVIELIDQKGVPSDNIKNIILESILVLPNYLSLLQTEKYDQPIVLIYYINRLKAVRKKPLLDFGSFLSNDFLINHSVVDIDREYKEINNIMPIALKVRKYFQSGYVSLQKSGYGKRNGEKNKLNESVIAIKNYVTNEKLAFLFWMFEAITSSIHVRHHYNKEFRVILLNIDKILQILSIEGEEGIDEKLEETILTEEFLKTLTYIVLSLKGINAHSDKLFDNKFLKSVSQSYLQINKSEKQILGSEKDLVSAVFNEVLLSLNNVTNQVDLYTRASNESKILFAKIVIELEEIINELNNIKKEDFYEKLNVYHQEIEVTKDSIERSIKKDISIAQEDIVKTTFLIEQLTEVIAELNENKIDDIEDLVDSLKTASDIVETYHKNSASNQTILAMVPRELSIVRGVLQLLNYDSSLPYIEQCDIIVNKVFSKNIVLEEKNLAIIAANIIKVKTNVDSIISSGGFFDKDISTKVNDNLLMQVCAKEAFVELYDLKEYILRISDQDITKKDALRKLPIFEDFIKRLFVMCENEVAVIISGIHSYLKETLLNPSNIGREKTTKDLQVIAYALIGIEFYLDSKKNNRKIYNDVLQKANKQIASLGVDLDTFDDKSCFIIEDDYIEKNTKLITTYFDNAITHRSKSTDQVISSSDVYHNEVEAGETTADDDEMDELVNSFETADELNQNQVETSETTEDNDVVQDLLNSLEAVDEPNQNEVETRESTESNSEVNDFTNSNEIVGELNQSEAEASELVEYMDGVGDLHNSFEAIDEPNQDKVEATELNENKDDVEGSLNSFETIDEPSQDEVDATELRENKDGVEDSFETIDGLNKDEIETSESAENVDEVDVLLNSFETVEVFNRARVETDKSAENNDEVDDEFLNWGNSSGDSNDLGNNTLNDDQPKKLPNKEVAELNMEINFYDIANIPLEQARYEDGIDREIAEIFIEEAEENLIIIKENLLLVHAGDKDALTLVRRSFHTLKGSGRMAEALRLGELAWSVENLLNNLIEETVPCSPEIISCIAQSVEFMPLLINEFKGGTRLGEAIENLMVEINKHSDGEVDAAPRVPTSNLFIADVEDSVENSVEEKEVTHDLQKEEENTLSEICNRHGLDPVLMGIFREEAFNHLTELRDRINIWEQTKNEFDYSNVIRNIHTIKGSGATSGIIELKEIFVIYEDMYNFFKSHHVNPKFFANESLLHAADATEKLLNNLHNSLEIPEKEELIEEASALYKRVVDELGNLSDESRNDFPEPDDNKENYGFEVDSNYVEPVAESALVSGELNSSARFISPEEDYDLEMYEDVFKEESDELCERLEESFNKLISNKQDFGLLQSIQRDIHTLKGSANVVSLTPIGEISHELENVFELINDKVLKVDDKIISLCFKYYDTITDMLDSAKEHQSLYFNDELKNVINQIVISKSSDIIDVSEINISSKLESVENDCTRFVEAGSGYEVELFEDVFKEEADELCERLEESFDRLKINKNDSELLQSIQRDIHTVKGSANIVLLKPIAEISHELENVFELINDDLMKVDDKIVVLCMTYYDVITDMLESAKKHENVYFNDKFKHLISHIVTSRDSGVFELSDINKVSVDEQKEKTESAEKSEEAAIGENESFRKERSLKVKESIIADLTNVSGELIISRSRLEQKHNQMMSSISDLDEIIDRLDEKLREFSILTESQMQSNTVNEIFQNESDKYGDEFDSLEMDRFSNVQTMTRSMSEALNDITSMKSMIENDGRDIDSFLLQESRLQNQLQNYLVRTRMMPFSANLPRLRKLVRNVSGSLGKQIDLDIDGDEDLDRSILERLMGPLEHLIRNAVDHGLETPKERSMANKSKVGKIRISVKKEGQNGVITVSDDGKGLPVNKIKEKAVKQGLIKEDQDVSDQEIIEFILKPGFSTADKVSQISGRGVGMDVVNSEIRLMGGHLQISSKPSLGSSFEIKIPLEMAINKSLLVNIQGKDFAIPINNIDGVVYEKRDIINRLYKNKSLFYENNMNSYEFNYLGKLLEIAEPVISEDQEKIPIILINYGNKRIALHVDILKGNYEIVVKPLSNILKDVIGVSGATIMGDGNVVMIVDIQSIVRGATIESLERQIIQDDNFADIVKTVMVVDDSITVRKVSERLLKKNGYEVVLGKDGLDALQQLHDMEVYPDVILLDIEMPKMDGFELARTIINSKNMCDIPIIMITSRTGAKHKSRAINIGVKEYLGKPFVEETLLKAIEDLT